ncbi:MAG: hypothetical protein LBH47_01475 [Christensenellaceae bacterium]|nr:hypothetical protein [Christensenellaceae bacterium]
MENYNYTPNVTVLIKLCNIFKVTADELLGRKPTANGQIETASVPTNNQAEVSGETRRHVKQNNTKIKDQFERVGWVGSLKRKLPFNRSDKSDNSKEA